MRSFLSVALGALCLVFALGRPAAAAPSGSYMSSCRNVHMTGQVLNAQCTNGAGQYVWTSINMQNCPNGPVGNNNGKLFCEGGGGGPGWGGPGWGQRPEGSWQSSCRNSRMSGNEFSAECTNGQSQWQSSSLNLASCPSRLVGNNNGRLFCEGGGGGGPIGNMPGGSWRSSCRDARMDGSVVRASCTNNQSSYRATAFNMNGCPGWALGNRDGNLFCEGGGNHFGPRFPGGSWQNSCRGASMNGHLFTAQCTQGNGAYRSSSIDMRGCPRRLVGNNNGQLFCEGPGNWGTIEPSDRLRSGARR